MPGCPDTGIACSGAPYGRNGNESGISLQIRASLRKILLESCNLHTVLDCPGGTFQGAGVKTVVLFFEKGAPTPRVWYYQLDPGRNISTTNLLNHAVLAEFIELQKPFADSPKSWSVDIAGIDKATFDLSIDNRWLGF